jgi:hypothetical protein
MLRRSRLKPRLECRKSVLEVTPGGDILEIAFSGVHGNSVGAELGDFVIETVKAEQPAAVVLNFLGFRYVGGDDIGGIVFAFFFFGEGGDATVRPCSIVAKGSTASSLLSLLKLGRLTQIADITFFEDVGEAVHHLRSRLE